MDSPPISVLLPTATWTAACDDVAGQLRPADELLVVCDRPDDPVAERAREAPQNVRLVVSGEPEGYSAKANAVAAGMEAARHDRVTWTDDDFGRPPDWLAALGAAYERHGPVTELPFFVGRDPLSVFLEPVYALGGTLGVYAGRRALAGAVLFERSDLDDDRLVADLRRTVSDDGLLSERLDVTPLRRVRRVDVGGSLRATLERHVRFTTIVSRHDPNGLAPMAAATAVLAAACLLAPLYAFAGATLLAAGVYAFFGVRWWTALLLSPRRPRTGAADGVRPRPGHVRLGRPALPLAIEV